MSEGCACKLQVVDGLHSSSFLRRQQQAAAWARTSDMCQVGHIIRSQLSKILKTAHLEALETAVEVEVLCGCQLLPQQVVLQQKPQKC